MAKALRRAAGVPDEPWELWPEQVKQQWLQVADVAIEARVRVLEETARAVPVDLWATYGRVPRATVEEFQKWLTDRAARMRRGETPHGH